MPFIIVVIPLLFIVLQYLRYVLDDLGVGVQFRVEEEEFFFSPQITGQLPIHWIPGMLPR
jgi:hypothetical protein